MKTDAVAVERFIIHTDAKKAKGVVTRRCRRYLDLYVVRLMSLSIFLVILSLILSGYIKIDILAVVLAFFCILVLSICLFSMSDLKKDKVPLGFFRLLRLYGELTMVKVVSIDDLCKLDNISYLLVGNDLINIIYNYKVHHISLRRDGTLCLIATKDNNDIPLSYSVDISTINDDIEKVNVVVDMSYIKAIPITN